MEFIVSTQIAIEAASPEEALEKTKPNEGQRISFNVSPRPQPPQQRTVSIPGVQMMPSGVKS